MEQRGYMELLTCTARLWRWTGGAGGGTWHFVTIDGEAGDVLSGIAAMRRLEGTARGFGSIKVMARIGGTHFATAVFPGKSGEGWLLPVKAGVRKAEDLADGDQVEVQLEF